MSPPSLSGDGLRCPKQADLGGGFIQEDEEEKRATAGEASALSLFRESGAMYTIKGSFGKQRTHPTQAQAEPACEERQSRRADQSARENLPSRHLERSVCKLDSLVQYIKQELVVDEGSGAPLVHLPPRCNLTPEDPKSESRLARVPANALARLRVAAYE